MRNAQLICLICISIFHTISCFHASSASKATGPRKESSHGPKDGLARRFPGPQSLRIINRQTGVRWMKKNEVTAGKPGKRGTSGNKDFMSDMKMMLPALKLPPVQRPSKEDPSRQLTTYNISEIPPIFRNYTLNLVATFGEWALASSNLEPENPTSTAGQVFLGTNAAYLAAGGALFSQGDVLLGGLTASSGVISYWYHYEQLAYPEPATQKLIALLVDYFVAALSIFTVSVYALEVGVDELPIESFLFGALALFFLFVGWFPPYGLPQFKPPWGGESSSYIAAHSLWHIFSASTALSVGVAHIESF
eukprot:CAMPEP_0172594568 /NCGR_PEP_ID=MMETSP1068-20121228/13996_1 /TAXON_ID=35684 /ORGANISM="Pseudopedinella elastica, Strain CCMP716" /LENGTH=306 /DNA_ID=CAMNT_0013392689 /DNA_START=5 /DNA_END=925 /DNA_ORIENTATION=+